MKLNVLNRFSRRRSSCRISTSCIVKKSDDCITASHTNRLVCSVLIVASCLPFASECHKIANSTLCDYCGADTFACLGSNMLATLPNVSTAAPLQTLNAKVQQVLLTLFKSNQKVINSTNDCNCIPLAWKCDGFADCQNGFDEINCDKSSCSPTSNFSCATNAKCISKQLFCNGKDDCGDNSDELDCTPRKCDINHETRCDNGRCIPSEWLCDQHDDCHDMSDERCFDENNDQTTEGEFEREKLETFTNTQACSKEQFQCRSGRCIRLADHCDGTAHCEDNSDEDACPHWRQCGIGSFRCLDGSCVGQSTVCDGRALCLDGSDESNSTCVPGVVPCQENGIPCQHLCVATASGHLCACKEGYRKGSDGRSCIDIDECHIGSSLNELDSNLQPEQPDVQACSQLCANSVPGFQCYCAEGYKLEADKQRCTAIQSSDAILFAAEDAHFSASLLKLTSFVRLETVNESNKIHRIKPIISLDFDYSENLIFWSNPKTQQIFRAKLELNHKSLIAMPFKEIFVLKPRAVVQSGLVEPSSISVDWISKRIFFTDANTSRIEFCNYDGSFRQVLLHRWINRPHSIVVHPEQRRLFWSDWQDSPRIETAFMDGSARQVIVSSLLNTPTNLVIDYPANKLYWTDRMGQIGLIECSNLDGSNRFVLLHEQTHHPVSLTIFEDLLYYSTANSNTLKSVNKLKGRNVTLVPFKNEMETNFDIELKVFHSLRQPKVTKGPCDSGPCSHICLPNNVTFQCWCPFGYSLKVNDSTKCQTNSDEYLLFTHRNEIRAVTVPQNIGLHSEAQSDVYLSHVLPIANISFVVSFDYAFLSEYGKTSNSYYPSYIYYCDIGRKSISRAKWDTQSQAESIVNSLLESPSGIAFDYATSNLYFTDSGRNVIEVVRNDGSFRSLVVWRSLDQPRDIVLSPEEGIMFWSQWSNKNASIERAAMDGSCRIILYSFDPQTRPQSLALDQNQKRLYWTRRTQIESSTYDGSDRRTVISNEMQHPFGLTISSQYVYWSDLSQKNVQRVHKNGGESQSIVYEGGDSLMDIAVLQHNRSVAPKEFIFTNACKQAKCSHLCLLTFVPPGFKCFCPTGIILRSDGLTCAEDMDNYLVFSTRKEIRRISLESEHHLDVIVPIEHTMTNALVLDVHSINKTVYWSDTEENAIYAANMLTGQSKPVVRFGLFGSNGLAVDQMGNKLYFSDAGRRRIEVIDLKSNARLVLISKDLDSPRTIAVDHKSGHMVWTDWGAQVLIERSSLDGQERAVLVSQNLGLPNGIAITNTGRIVWADSKMHTIEMVDLNGTNRRRLAQDLPSPFGVTVTSDDKYLFFTDWETKSVSRIKLAAASVDNNENNNLQKPEIFAKSLSNLVDIRAVNQKTVIQSSPFQHNMCQINNGGCSHLCLRNSAPGYSCFCPTGMNLYEDAKTCKTDISEQLLIACKTNFRRVSLDTNDWIDVFLPLDGFVDVVTLDYHLKQGKIFYVDAAFKEIRCITLLNHSLNYLGALEEERFFSVQTLVSVDLMKPNSVAVDWMSNNIYWSDKERHRIEVARLDGSARKVLIDLDFDEPKCLLVLPDFGFMFWLNVGNTQRLERAFLDGSGRVTLVHQDIGQLNGMTIARSSEPTDFPRIYWTDGVLQRIESIRIDGTERKMILSRGLTLPFSIAACGDFIYWTDPYNKVVERANRWTADDYRLVAEHIEALQEIKFVSHSIQTARSSQNPCAVDNGACSHLCLFRPQGYICACPSYSDQRPCSTVPGEVVSASNSAATNSVNNVVLNESNSNRSKDIESVQSDIKRNDSQLLNDRSQSCPDNMNVTKCNSFYRFSFDDYLIQVAYVFALVLLSLSALICAVLIFICKRKLMRKDTKLSQIIDYATSGKSFTARPFLSTSQEIFEPSYNQLERYRIDDLLPPLPPPPRSFIEQRCNTNVHGQLYSSNVQLCPVPTTLSLSRMSNFTYLQAEPLARSQQSTPNVHKRAQTLPRPSTGPSQINHSVLNSPYNDNSRSVSNETSRLETDI